MSTDKTVRAAIQSVKDGNSPHTGAREVLRVTIDALSEDYRPEELLAAMVETNSAMQAAMTAAVERLERQHALIADVMIVVKTQRELDRKIMRLIEKMVPHIRERKGGEPT